MKQAKRKIKEFKSNKVLIGALATEFNKSFITIERWVAKNDDRLSSDRARKVFEEYGLKTAEPV